MRKIPESLVKDKIYTVNYLVYQDDNNDKNYLYIAVRRDQMPAFQNALKEGNFDAEDYGIILEQGNGEASDTLIEKMRIMYNCDHDSSISISDFIPVEAALYENSKLEPEEIYLEATSQMAKFTEEVKVEVEKIEEVTETEFKEEEELEEEEEEKLSPRKKNELVPEQKRKIEIKKGKVEKIMEVGTKVFQYVLPRSERLAEAKVKEAEYIAELKSAEADLKRAEAEKVRAEADKLKSEAEKIRSETK